MPEIIIKISEKKVRTLCLNYSKDITCKHNDATLTFSYRKKDSNHLKGLLFEYEGVLVAVYHLIRFAVKLLGIS
jgi:hypothetical protein